jgi:urease accessory protein
MTALQLLQLLHLADSALPVGAAAHSFGLEGLVVENHLDVPDLFQFLEAYLEETGRLEAVFVYAGYDAATSQEWRELNQQMSAMKPARETRDASLRLGKRLAGLAADAFALPIEYTEGAAHLPLLFGHVGRCIGCPGDEVAAAYLHQSVAGLVSACQRLLPLGQSGAAALLWKLKPVILASLAVARGTHVNAVCLSQPLLDVASSRHPDLGTRLFIS